MRGAKGRCSFPGIRSLQARLGSRGTDVKTPLRPWPPLVEPPERRTWPSAENSARWHRLPLDGFISAAPGLSRQAQTEEARSTRPEDVPPAQDQVSGRTVGGSGREQPLGPAFPSALSRGPSGLSAPLTPCPRGRPKGLEYTEE